MRVEECEALASVLQQGEGSAGTLKHLADECFGLVVTAAGNKVAPAFSESFSRANICLWESQLHINHFTPTLTSSSSEKRWSGKRMHRWLGHSSLSFSPRQPPLFD